MADSEEQKSTPFTLRSEPLDGHRRLRIRVIGAGYSGIYLGIRIPQRLRNMDLVIYEKNESVGGTWWVNRYPGMVPLPRATHTYLVSKRSTHTHQVWPVMSQLTRISTRSILTRTGRRSTRQDTKYVPTYGIQQRNSEPPDS